MLFVLLADTTKMAIGWGIVAGGILLGGAAVAFPWRRKNPLPEEAKEAKKK